MYDETKELTLRVHDECALYAPSISPIVHAHKRVFASR